MKVSLQPVRVANRHEEEGMLVFADDRLVAVLVRLSDIHEGLAGEWFVETGFGPLEGREHPVFADLKAAEEWITRRLQRQLAEER